MTKQTTTANVSGFTTDAKFRAWGLAASTALQASRLVKTADTGQIDWATVAKPTATNTQAGYEIYRFDDDLQGTAPVFLRIGYGSGGVTSGNSPTTWLTVGTGSNGSGTITGLTLGPWQGFNTSVTVDNTAMPMSFTHTDDGYCWMNFGREMTVGSPQMMAGNWILDRTRDPDTGAATAEGLLVVRANVNNTTEPYHQYSMSFSTATAYSTSNPYPMTGLANLQASNAGGDTVPLGRMFMALGTLRPSTSIVCYFNADIPVGTTFDAAPWGSTHTYLAMGQAMYYFSAAQTGATNARAAVRWED